MSLLGAPLQLHDVRDAEAFCRTVLDRTLAYQGGRLRHRPDLYESALTYLLETLWDLSQRYDPERVRDPETGEVRVAFSTYATPILAKRISDWYRDELGDSRYGTRPSVLSLDELREREDRFWALEESDYTTVVAQGDLLTKLALATSVPFESPLEEREAAQELWRQHIESGEAA